MIVLSFIDEIKLIINLIAIGMTLIFGYDLIIWTPKKAIVYPLELLYTISMIIVSPKLAFNLNDGFIPQYGLLFIVLGMILYLCYFQEKVQLIKAKIKPIIRDILKPLTIFKQTIKALKTKKIVN